MGRFWITNMKFSTLAGLEAKVVDISFVKSLIILHLYKHLLKSD